METKLLVTQKAIYELAKSKGWWPRPFGESIALLHSELSEALEEWRDGYGFNEIYYPTYWEKTSQSGGGIFIEQKRDKPEGIPIEMGDFAIRLMDLAESEEIELARFSFDYDKEANFACDLAGLHQATALLRADKMESFNYLWATTKAVCLAYQIPLFRAINLKHEYNKTRDFRHGGKLA